MLRIDKKVMWGNQSYDGYQVSTIEWDLVKDKVFMGVVYFQGKKWKYIKHEMDHDQNINVNEMINHIHNLHK